MEEIALGSMSVAATRRSSGALLGDGVPIHDGAELALGNGTLLTYPVGELLPVYRVRRHALQALLDRHYVADEAVRWGDPTVRACLRCPECQTQIVATNDVLLVAGLRNTERARLIDAGIACRPVRRGWWSWGPFLALAAR